MSILKKIFKGVCNLAYSHPELCVVILGWGTAAIMGYILNLIHSGLGSFCGIVSVLLSLFVAIFGTRFLVHWYEAFDLQEDNPTMTLKTAWNETKITMPIPKVFRSICNLAYNHVIACMLVLGGGCALILVGILIHFNVEFKVFYVIMALMVAMFIGIFNTRFLVHWAETFELMESDLSLTVQEAWKATKLDWRNIMKR